MSLKTVTLLEAGAVSMCLVANFLKADQKHVAILKSEHLELLSVTGRRVYRMYIGKLISMSRVRWSGDTIDFLFVLLDTFQTKVIRFYSTGDIIIAKERIKSALSLPDPYSPQCGVFCAVDERTGDGWINTTDYSFSLFNVFSTNHHLNELCFTTKKMYVLQMQTLKKNIPTLLVMTREGQDQFFIEYSRNRENVFKCNMWRFHSHALTTFTSLNEKILVVFGHKRVLLTHHDKNHCQPVACDLIRDIKCCTVINESLLVVGNPLGDLYVVTIPDSGKTSIIVKHLGTFSELECLTHLNDNVLFVGSLTGDSKMILIDNYEKPSYKEISTYPNIGPVIDFCVVDQQEADLAKYILCTGQVENGNLVTVSKALDVTEKAVIELPKVQRVWSICENLVVATFVGVSRIYRVTDKEVKEISLEGFNETSGTVCCKTVEETLFVQTTEQSVRLICSREQMICDEWKPYNKQPIIKAVCKGCHIVLSTGKDLYYLRIIDRLVELRNFQRTTSDVACLDVRPVKGNMGHVAIGFYDNTVSILRLPCFSEVKKMDFDETMIRSLLFATIQGTSYFFCGLEDGRVSCYRINMFTCELTQRKIFTVGTRPVKFQVYETRGARRVFAHADRCASFFTYKGHLICFPVDISDVQDACVIAQGPFAHNFIFAKDQFLVMGTIDQSKKYVAYRVPLAVNPKFIAFDDDAKIIALGISAKVYGDSGDIEVEHGIDIFDYYTMKLLYMYEDLSQTERVSNLISCKFDDNIYFVMSTYCEGQPNKSKLYVLDWYHRKLRTLFKKEYDVLIYTVQSFEGDILVGTSEALWVMQWTEDRVLEKISEDDANPSCINLNVHEDFILTGIFSRTLYLQRYCQKHKLFQTVTKFKRLDMVTSMYLMNSRTFLCVSSAHNLYYYRCSQKFIREYCIPFGNHVNMFRRGPLKHSVVFGTTAGALILAYNLTDYSLLSTKKVLEWSTQSQFPHRFRRKSIQTEDKLLEFYDHLTPEQLQEFAHDLESSVQDLYAFKDDIDKLDTMVQIFVKDVKL